VLNDFPNTSAFLYPKRGGVGDSPGDIPLLRRVGYSACPGNADPSVKKIVNLIATKDFSDGVLEILEDWISTKHTIRNSRGDS
jgi:3-deoxy-D-manno-octulosonate 8-phosphate phosphatase KdsC-like HAD superfamily phosphatase